MGLSAWARSKVAASPRSRFYGFQLLASSSGSLVAQSGPAPASTATLPFSFACFSTLIARTASAVRPAGFAASTAPSKTWHLAPEAEASTENWLEWAVAVTEKTAYFQGRALLPATYPLHLPYAGFFFFGEPVSFVAFAVPAHLIFTRCTNSEHSGTCFAFTAEFRYFRI